jgi:hypothetical protein
MHFRSVLLVLLLFISATEAYAQVDRANQTTRKEMVQLRRLAESYKLESLEPSDIDWPNSEIWRVDLNDDGKAEAIFTYEGTNICGAIACMMLVIQWHGTKAEVLSIINDGFLQVLKRKTNGWHDLQGHYYFYKWNGQNYDRICRRDCER